METCLFASSIATHRDERRHSIILLGFDNDFVTDRKHVIIVFIVSDGYIGLLRRWLLSTGRHTAVLLLSVSTVVVLAIFIWVVICSRDFLFSLNMCRCVLFADSDRLIFVPGLE